MYARGMSVREIQAHLLELYGTDVSPNLISTITDEVLDEVAQWQQRPLEAMYPPEVRSIIYTTNAIESLHMRLRKIVKNRGHFPSYEAATKLLFLALRNIEKDWKMPQRNWKQAADQFAIMFDDRFTMRLTNDEILAPHTEFLTGPCVVLVRFHAQFREVALQRCYTTDCKVRITLLGK
jgi:transposase-like protein